MPGKRKPEPPKPVESRSILYGPAPVIKRPAAEPEAAEEEAPPAVDIDGYSVIVAESRDPFLVAAQKHWAFRVTSPEGAEYAGQAKSRRRAERQVRQYIASNSRIERKKRERREKIDRLKALLDRHQIEVYIGDLERVNLEIEELPGEYVLLSYRSDRGFFRQEKSQYSGDIYRSGKKLVETRGPSRARAKKMALNSLTEFLAAERLRDDSEPDSGNKPAWI